MSAPVSLNSPRMTRNSKRFNWDARGDAVEEVSSTLFLSELRRLGSFSANQQVNEMGDILKINHPVFIGVCFDLIGAIDK